MYGVQLHNYNSIQYLLHVLHDNNNTVLQKEPKQFLMLSNIAHRELEKMEVKVNSLGSSQGLKLVIINLKNCPDQYNSCTTFFYS